MTSGVPRIPSLRAPAHRPLAYLRLRAALLHAIDAGELVPGQALRGERELAREHGVSLEERFMHLTQADNTEKGLAWLHGSSDSE